jgi:hypothetical protein
MAKPQPATDPRIELLPGQLRPVAELAGFDGVELLIEHFGGQRLYVPRVVPSAAVAQKCGAGVASALHKNYGGDYVVVPLARALATARKHDAIRKDKRPASEVAREWRMSVNSIYRIRGDQPAPAPQTTKPVAKSRRDDRVVDIEEMIDRAGRR